jgi:hypothetical protein
MRTVELLQYTLKASTEREFHQIMVEESIPSIVMRTLTHRLRKFNA